MYISRDLDVFGWIGKIFIKDSTLSTCKANYRMIKNGYVTDSNIFSPSSWPGSVSSTLDTFYSSVVIKYCLVLFINAEFTKSVKYSHPIYQVFISRNWASKRISDGKGNGIATVLFYIEHIDLECFFAKFCSRFHLVGSTWPVVLHLNRNNPPPFFPSPTSFNLPLSDLQARRKIYFGKIWDSVKTDWYFKKEIFKKTTRNHGGHLGMGFHLNCWYSLI